LSVGYSGEEPNEFEDKDFLTERGMKGRKKDPPTGERGFEQKKSATLVTRTVS